MAQTWRGNDRGTFLRASVTQYAHLMQSRLTFLIRCHKAQRFEPCFRSHLNSRAITLSSSH